MSRKVLRMAPYNVMQGERYSFFNEFDVEIFSSNILWNVDDITDIQSVVKERDDYPYCWDANAYWTYMNDPTNFLTYEQLVRFEPDLYFGKTNSIVRAQKTILFIDVPESLVNNIVTLSQTLLEREKIVVLYTNALNWNTAICSGFPIFDVDYEVVYFLEGTSGDYTVEIEKPILTNKFTGGDLLVIRFGSIVQPNYGYQPAEADEEGNLTVSFFYNYNISGLEHDLNQVRDLFKNFDRYFCVIYDAVVSDPGLDEDQATLRESLIGLSNTVGSSIPPTYYEYNIMFPELEDVLSGVWLESMYSVVLTKILTHFRLLS